MSEVFDPDSVDRWDVSDSCVEGNDEGNWVHAADYLKLLALYRELVRQRADELEDARGEAVFNDI